MAEGRTDSALAHNAVSSSDFLVFKEKKIKNRRQNVSVNGIQIQLKNWHIAVHDSNSYFGKG